MKEKYLGFIAGLIVISIVFFMWSTSIYNNKTTQIRRLDLQIRRAQERLNSAKVLNEQLGEVSRVIENVLTTQRDFEADEINILVKDFAELADRYKIAIYSLTPRSAFTGRNVAEQQFVMDVMATYVQLGQFMTELESFDQIIRVNKLDVKPQDTPYEFLVDGEPVTQYRVQLEISAFKIVKEG